MAQNGGWSGMEVLSQLLTQNKSVSQLPGAGMGYTPQSKSTPWTPRTLRHPTRAVPSRAHDLRHWLSVCPVCPRPVQLE